MESHKMDQTWLMACWFLCPTQKRYISAHKLFGVRTTLVIFHQSLRVSNTSLHTW